jgi:hypothetical protein
MSDPGPEFELDQRVQVGGCVGLITVITNDIVAVSGRYHYAGGGYEDWIMTYDKSLVRQKSKWNDSPWDDMWNFEDVEPEF